MFCDGLIGPTYTNADDLRVAFFNYIDKEVYPKNERKSERILEIANSINCFKCFDIKCLITDRKYLPISSLDCKGSFDLIKCDFCGDGSIIKPTKYFREKVNYKTLQYAKMVHLEDIASELYFLSLENEVGEPEWEFAENESFTHKITQLSIDVDIKEVINSVKTMITDYFADPSLLSSFIETLELKIKHFYGSTKGTKEICKKVEKNGETTFILFDLEKEVKKSSGSSNLFQLSFNKQSESIITHLMCIQPKNKMAEKICTEMMNKKVKNMMNTVTNYNNKTSDYTSVKGK